MPKVNGVVEEVYQIEEILDRRRFKGVIQYLIKWQGYESQHNSWEPKCNIICEDVVVAFELERKVKKQTLAKVAKAPARRSSDVTSPRKRPRLSAPPKYDAEDDQVDSTVGGVAATEDVQSDSETTVENVSLLDNGQPPKSSLEEENALDGLSAVDRIEMKPCTSTTPDVNDEPNVGPHEPGVQPNDGDQPCSAFLSSDEDDGMVRVANVTTRLSGKFGQFSTTKKLRRPIVDAEAIATAKDDEFDANADCPMVVRNSMEMPIQSGFEQGLKPRKILGATEYNGGLCFLMLW